jgi:hypothetical protein
MRFHMTGYSFESKDDPACVPLRAVNFVAYESYRQIDNQVLNRGLKLDSNAAWV